MIQLPGNILWTGVAMLISWRCFSVSVWNRRSVDPDVKAIQTPTPATAMWEITIPSSWWASKWLCKKNKLSLRKHYIIQPSLSASQYRHCVYVLHAKNKAHFLCFAQDMSWLLHKMLPFLFLFCGEGFLCVFRFGKTTVLYFGVCIHSMDYIGNFSWLVSCLLTDGVRAKLSRSSDFWMPAFCSHIPTTLEKNSVLR